MDTSDAIFVGTFGGISLWVDVTGKYWYHKVKVSKGKTLFQFPEEQFNNVCTIRKVIRFWIKHKVGSD